MTSPDTATRPSLNPVATLLTAAVIAVALVLSVDWVSAMTALVQPCY